MVVANLVEICGGLKWPKSQTPNIGTFAGAWKTGPSCHGEGEGVSLSGSLQKLMAERVTFQLIISVVARSSSAMR